MIFALTSPCKFATSFNSTVPGAHRQVSVEDVRDMTEAGLIGKYRYYDSHDLEVVRGVLEYERLRSVRSEELAVSDLDDGRHCKKCGVPLPHTAQGQVGRPREYCHDCQFSRGADRARMWRQHSHIVPH